MLKFYIIASMENFIFAEKLLGGLKVGRVLINTPFSRYGQNILLEIQKEIAEADVVIAIIDNDFSKNSGLYYELRTAKFLSQEKQSKVLIPIILNDAEIPRCIKDMSYILCDSKSDQDLYNLQKTITNFIKHTFKPQRKKRDKTGTMIMLTLTMVIFTSIFIASTATGSDIIHYEIGNENSPIIAVLLLSITTTMAALITSYLFIIKKRWQEDDDNELESYSRRLKQAIIPDELKEETQDNGSYGNTKEIDALGRMMINLEDIKEFYTWSQKQAKGSFILAVSMCICGFILMVIAVILPITHKQSMEVSIIPAVGGMLTEVIAGTALVVYRNSLSQLNHYHKALHEDERFLSSVNLLGKFNSDTIRDDMLKEIIRSEIQMNILGLQENDSNDTRKRCDNNASN